jgi:hypothetical protein
MGLAGSTTVRRVREPASCDDAVYEDPAHAHIGAVGMPIPRADIPAGLILSREADAWIREEDIEDTALPFMQGAMPHQFAFSQKGWLSGAGLQARWEPIAWDRKVVNPQFLMGWGGAGAAIGRDLKVGFRRIARNTDTRTRIASLVPRMPCGDVASVLRLCDTRHAVTLPLVLNARVIDYLYRTATRGRHSCRLPLRA